jgi:hypothetical protein
VVEVGLDGTQRCRGESMVDEKVSRWYADRPSSREWIGK